ncbi:MAG: aminotransferase class I/II-fold pyridoxal phosphate-dependent enzyme [Microthrixaceae bacterium]|nr:aminotransferase class I/II-fold pyridoxal phosphate-dependent enzyme [Microthrixaceae bacterium]
MSAAAGDPGFVPPPYPYDRLTEMVRVASDHRGGAVDLSIGTPTDAPPPEVVDALARSGAERGYPPSVGTGELRGAAAKWLEERFGVQPGSAALAACVGTKEFVAGLPHWLALRQPSRDTVLYPAVSYPSYAMGATLARCRAVPVAVGPDWTLELDSISQEDAERALCLWVNSPGNPAGGVDDLGAVAQWGRSHGVPVFSDECYVEFTWEHRPVASGGEPGASILEHGSDGVVAVHSLSKRSNLAGLRVGFYAGDEELVGYLSELRKHAGFMVPGPTQAAAAVALGSQDHVREQRARYAERLEFMASLLASIGIEAPLPGGGFYLWVPAPDGDSWALTRYLAQRLGVVASPGEFYGSAGSAHVRLAMVRPMEDLERVAQRLR